jgi:hypothetical protein
MSKNKKSLPITMSVPRLGKLLYGSGEASSYDLVERGHIITINIAEPGKKKRLRAPVRPNLLRIAGNDPSLLNDLVNDLLAKLEAEKSSAAA